MKDASGRFWIGTKPPFSEGPHWFATSSVTSTMGLQKCMSVILIREVVLNMLPTSSVIAFTSTSYENYLGVIMYFKHCIACQLTRFVPTPNEFLLILGIMYACSHIWFDGTEDDLWIWQFWLAVQGSGHLHTCWQNCTVAWLFPCQWILWSWNHYSLSILRQHGSYNYNVSVGRLEGRHCGVEEGHSACADLQVPQQCWWTLYLQRACFQPILCWLLLVILSSILRCFTMVG